MPAITIKGLTLSPAARQTPRIIVPIMADTVTAAVQQAAALAALPAAELVELRLDPLLAAGVPAADLPAVVAAVQKALRADQPLLATIRTRREGGQFAMTPDTYADACRTLLAAAARPDLLDVEFSAGAAVTEALVRAARATGVVTVFSEHHFEGTPDATLMGRHLCAMAQAGADIIKLAVMPHSQLDVAALLQATALAAEVWPDPPRITMAMGALGAVTRVCGGAFGSCATFGAAGRTSAPGQPDAAALHTALRALADCL